MDHFHQTSHGIYIYDTGPAFIRLASLVLIQAY